jgi:hypothetical protein
MSKNEGDSRKLHEVFEGRSNLRNAIQLAEWLEEEVQRARDRIKTLKNELIEIEKQAGLV